MKPLFISGLSALTLSACAAATPPSITEADVTAAQAEEARISALPVATADQLPSAQATYEGQLGGDVTIDGDDGYAILGDISLTANFAGLAALTGTVDNINLIEDGTPTQLLGGELSVSGTNTATTFSATATGTLDAVGEDLPFRGEADVQLSIAGDYRVDTTATGSTTSLLGTWAGGSNGGEFDVQGSGDVYATEQ